MGASIDGNSKNSETFLCSHKKLDDLDSHHDDDHQDDQSTPLKPIKIKVDHSVSTPSAIDDDDNDGFKTPTGAEHKIQTDLPCPGAPRKLKPPPSKRRRLSGRFNDVRFIEVSREEIESLFTPRSIMIRDIHHLHRAGNIKKVNKANLTTLVSFR